VSASNTKECILDFRGCKLVGVLMHKLPLSRQDIARKTITLLFDNGEGLTFSAPNAHPTYWSESKEDISRALHGVRKKLQDTSDMLGDVLHASGCTDVMTDSLTTMINEPFGLGATPMVYEGPGLIGYVKRDPVSIWEFVSNPYYLGGVYGKLSSEIVSDLGEFFGGGYNEAILVQRSSNDGVRFASICVCYFLYCLSCLADPQKYYSLIAESNITILCLDRFYKRAEGALSDIARKLRLSPYFRSHFFPSSGSFGELVFPSNILLKAASSIEQLVGMNALFGVLREYDDVSEAWARELYAGLRTRMISRFGFTSWSLLTVSDAGGFTIKLIDRKRSDPSVFIKEEIA
jgi:hypothetical protein